MNITDIIWVQKATRGRRSAAAQRQNVNLMVGGSILTRRNELFTFIGTGYRALCTTARYSISQNSKRKCRKQCAPSSFSLPCSVGKMQKF